MDSVFHHYQDMDMTAPYTWKHGWADVYASRNGSDVEDYLTWVIRPSLAALEIQRQKFVDAAEHDVVFHFSLSDHERLIKRTYMTFALAIQSMWEQQLRSYMTTCASGGTIEGVTRKKLEKGTWGDELNGVFFRVRGIELDSFDSYAVLTQLQMLGNACRHGNGDSARGLYIMHPELWHVPLSFPWLDASMVPPLPPQPPIEDLRITLELLIRYVSAIVLFWVDMDRLGMESLLERQPELHCRVAELSEHRIPLLALVRG